MGLCQTVFIFSLPIQGNVAVISVLSNWCIHSSASKEWKTSCTLQGARTFSLWHELVQQKPVIFTTVISKIFLLSDLIDAFWKILWTIKMQVYFILLLSNSFYCVTLIALPRWFLARLSVFARLFISNRVVCWWPNKLHIFLRLLWETILGFCAALSLNVWLSVWNSIFQ